MVEKKFEAEGIVNKIQKVETVTEGGLKVRFWTQIKSRGQDTDLIIDIKSSEPSKFIEGEVVKIEGFQVQKSLTDDFGPNVNNGIEVVKVKKNKGE